MATESLKMSSPSFLLGVLLFAGVEALEIRPNTDNLREGQPAFFSCVGSESHLKPLSYEWSFDGQHIIGSNRTIHSIARLSKKHHFGKVLKCIVSDKAGTVETATYTLQFQYAPNVTRTTSSEAVVQPGDSVVFGCQVQAFAQTPQINWITPGHSKATDGPRLEINNVSEDDFGTYTCQATVPGFPPANQSFELFMTGPPTVSFSSANVAVAKGKGTFLECLISGRPFGVGHTVHWSMRRENCKGEDFGEITTQRATIDKTFKRGFDFVSRLRLAHIQDGDFGCYKCTARNDYGEDSAVVNVEENVGSFLYLMISGVIGGCAAILAIAVAYFCLNKKNMSKSGTDKQKHSDTSNALMTNPVNEWLLRDDSQLLLQPQSNDERRASVGYVWDHEVNAYVPILVPEDVIEESIRQASRPNSARGSYSTAAGDEDHSISKSLTPSDDPNVVYVLAPVNETYPLCGIALEPVLEVPSPDNDTSCSESVM